MPTIRLRCPTCHAEVELDREHVGREVECGACMGVFVAPDPDRPRLRVGVGIRPLDGPPAADRPRRRHEDDEYDHDRPDPDDDRPRRRYADPPKSRLAYILLALAFGGLGVHNFYAGRTGPGLSQLVVFLASIPLMLLLVGCLTIFVPYIWALVDIVTVDRDGDGRRMV